MRLRIFIGIGIILAVILLNVAKESSLLKVENKEVLPLAKSKEASVKGGDERENHLPAYCEHCVGVHQNTKPIKIEGDVEKIKKILSQDTSNLTFESSEDGADFVHLNGSFGHISHIVRDADGNITAQCAGSLHEYSAQNELLTLDK